jgi:hypothetical protein
MRSSFRRKQIVVLLMLGLAGLSHAATAQAPILVSSSPRANASRATEIARAMGSVRWGMSKDALQRRLASVSPCRDAGLLRGELTPDSDESLLERRDQTTRTFYSFRAGKLWKIYEVFEPLLIPEGNFAAFAAALERHFGAGETFERQSSPSTPRHRHFVEWNEGRTRVRAIDETNGNGFYSLTFEDRARSTDR